MDKPVEPQQLLKIEQVLGPDATATRPSRRRLAVYGVIGAALLALLVWLAASGSSGPAVRYVTEPVVRGNLTVIVTATGSVQPTNHGDRRRPPLGPRSVLRPRDHTSPQRGPGTCHRAGAPRARARQMAECHCQAQEWPRHSLIGCSP